MRKFVLALLVTVGSAAGVTAPTSTAATAATATTVTELTAATTPGTVLSSAPSPHLVEALAPHTDVIEYATSTETGAPTVASATVFEPAAPWTGAGPRPTIIMAPGTRGQGDQCAPSQAVLHVASFRNGSLNFDYEYTNYLLALAAGMRVIVPDYIGLGTPGLHTYVNNVEEAHALLDAARAGLNHAAQPLNSPIGFFGYSQGGGAVAAAAEYAGTYAPELNIRGTYAGAPPANLLSVMDSVDGSAIAGVLGYSLGSYSARHPEFSQVMQPLLNERGRAFFADAPTSCIADSIARWGFTHTNTLTTTGESISQILARHPELQSYMQRQKLGQHPLHSPMLIISSPTDDLIPYPQAKALGGDLCHWGGTVQLLDAPAFAVIPGTAFGHALPLAFSNLTGLHYLFDRFNGVPAPSNCR